MPRLIVVCSDKEDNNILNSIKLILKKSLFNCFFISQQKTERHIGEKGHDSIIVMQIDNINKLINTRPDILIFDEGIKIENYEKTNITDKSNATALVYDNFDSSITQFLKDEKYVVISCGINPKDTITISSVTDDSISIFIQRELSSLDLKKIEQQEFCVFSKDLTNQYPIIAAVVSAILLGFEKEFFEKIIF